MRFGRGIPLVALLVAAIVCTACGGESAAVGQGTPPVPVGPGEGILFIGNSLTYQNDLPGMVEGLAEAAGQKLPSAQVAFGGYSLADHLQQGDALRAIARGGWRVVVLQQGLQGNRTVASCYATIRSHSTSASAPPARGPLSFPSGRTRTVHRRSLRSVTRIRWLLLTWAGST